MFTIDFDDLHKICCHAIKKWFNITDDKYLQDFKLVGSRLELIFHTTPQLNGIKAVSVVGAKDCDNKENHDDIEDAESNACLKGFDCKIYKEMKDNCQCTQSNYNHISKYNHFGFNYDNKPRV